MKRVISFAICALFVVFVVRADDDDEIQEHEHHHRRGPPMFHVNHECAEEAEVTPEMFKHFRSTKEMNEELHKKLACYKACDMKHQHLMEDGRIKKETIIKKMDDCIDEVEVIEDECERAMAFSKCFPLMH